MTTVTRWATFKAVLVSLATTRATYRFIALLLVTFGAAKLGPIVEGIGGMVCVIIAGGCAAG